MAALLTLVPAPPPSEDQARRLRIRATKKGSELQCGCGSRDAIEVRSGAMLRGRSVAGGTVIWLCAACLMQGRRVVLA